MLVSQLFVFLVLIALAYKIFDFIWRHPKLLLSTKTRNILVTGCDSGFGNLLTKRMDRKGFRVFAGCLTPDGVESLRESCSSQARPFLLDVTNAENVEQAVEYVKSTVNGEGLWVLVNNAGIAGLVAQASWMNKKDYDDVFSINFHGVRHMCEAFLPMLKQSRGRIVNTASVMGRVSATIAAPYSVSKYAVEAFSDALRRDLCQFGVSVHIIEPGYFKTNILSFTDIKATFMRKWYSIPDGVKMQYGEDYPKKYMGKLHQDLENASSKLELVVDAYEHAMLAIRPRARYIVGLDAKLIFVPLSILPAWFGDKLLACPPIHHRI